VAPWIAALICSTGVAGLFWLDREKTCRTSPGLWLAVTWLILSCSRSVSEWLNYQAANGSPMEGSPLDRAVYSSLIVVGVVILFRRRRVSQIVRMNAPIVLSFLFCAISVLWSDYSDIAFKRWIKALGDLIMVLIIISDRNRICAVNRLLARAGFLLIPCSVLFIKYYPALGRSYSRWEGTAMYNGVATTKNDLGAICLLCGLSALWRIISEIRSSARKARIGPIVAQGTVLLMVVWLLRIANSMTSLWCFLIGAILLLATSYYSAVKKSRVVPYVVTAIVLIPFSMLFLHVGTNIAHDATGRDIQTLTTRTEVWTAALKLQSHPFFGTGFESFWLGRRLQTMWNIFWWHPGEAHNGYLEVYLNLGWSGIVMLGIVIVTGYRTVIASVRRNSREGSLMLTFFTVAIVYNFTEAAFFQMMTPIWFMFLLVTMRAPTAVIATDGNNTRSIKSNHQDSKRPALVAVK
jgi:exopolysaccharide production protein ExoQ